MFDSCICVDPGGDGGVVLSQSWRTAHKQHVCGECRQTIEPGERYEHCVDKANGESHVVVHKTCLGCYRVRTSLFRCGWYWGEIWEAIDDMYCDEECCVCPTRE